MNNMNRVNTDKKYKIANEVHIEEENESVGKMIFRFGLLAIICVLAFLVAKYIVRSNIDGEKSPIDTSERI